MKLIKVAIENFRCLKNKEINLEQITCFVGNNSAGKSTILQAIDHLLNTDKFVPTDFYMFREKDLRITGHFRLDESEKEVLESLFNHEFQELILSKIGKIDGDCTTSYEIQIPVFENKLLNIEYVNGRTKKEYVDAVKNGELPEYFDTKTIDGIRSGIMKYIKENNPPRKGTTGKSLTKTEREKLPTPTPLYVPAFENIAEQTKFKKRNIFGKLLKEVFVSLQENNEFKRWEKQYKMITERLFGDQGSRRVKEIVEFENELSSFLNEILPTRVSLNFDIPPVDDFLLNRFSVYLDDGVKTDVASKGHGAQRAVIWSLLRYYLKYHSGNTTDSMFLVEEPELYLHPQAQRVMLKTLKELAGTHQVIYSTHSPVFVDLENPTSIRVVKKGKDGTDICELTSVSQDEKSQLRFLKWMGDAHNEIFFAKSVILYEGATEKLLLTHMNKYPINQVGDVNLEKRIKGRIMNFDELGCQIISTGGKFSMPFFTKLLYESRIPFFVIYDRDNTDSITHKDTNDHIQQNVQKARSSNLRAESKIFVSRLEEEWELDHQSDEKVDRIYSLLQKQPEDWPVKVQAKYSELKKKLYKFAWYCFLTT